MVERVEITELSDNYLRCRAWGHAWDDHPTGVVNSELYRLSFAIEVLRCTRCAMERFYYLNADMKPFQRYYRKPPRYDTIVGQGKRPNVRNEMLKRSLLLRAAKRTRNGKK